MEITLSDVLGAILVLIGLWLIITGAPRVAVAEATTGFWDIIKDIYRDHPRVGVGIILVILGGTFLGVINFGPLLVGGTSPTS